MNTPQARKLTFEHAAGSGVIPEFIDGISQPYSLLAINFGKRLDRAGLELIE